MRYARYIVAFVALILAAACTISDIDDTPINVVGSKGSLQVVGRVTQYADCDVATRSKKDGDEPKVTSMGLALFPIEDGAIKDCVYYDFQLGGSIVFIVDRHDAIFNNYENKPFAMYIFANMQDADGFPMTADAGKGKSLEYFTKCASAANVNVKDVPENGFPMMGSLGNTLNINGIVGDGVKLILKPEQTGDNVDGLPLVGEEPTDNLEIPLRAMYAKFSFTITVKPDQEIVGNKAPRFDLVSYELHNIPSTVDTNSSTNDDTDVIVGSGDISVGNYAQGATVAEFDFYLPERYLTPTTTAENFEYPLGANGAGVNGYSNIPAENQKYAQRYKPLLPGSDQAATYVTITGKYTDHQGHIYDVDYNIYLGGDSYGNFDVLRNTHYNNSITIRGISSSNDQATNTSAISIDHRVDINRSTPLVIGLRRETLLDAHFEVRPLRLRLVGENIPNGTSATVQVLNEDGTDVIKTSDAAYAGLSDDEKSKQANWIRLEASGSSSDHITSGTSAGKRKYFTTDLVTNTLKKGTSVTVENLTGSNQTVWIYVDENTSTTTRTAIVRVSYNGVDKDYKIVQNGLYAVKVKCYDGVERTFYIEQYEEYLYNYDAEDSYGQIKEEGMPWGLNNGKVLSNKHDSFTCNETNSDWTSYIAANPIKYDFYIRKHDDDNEASDEKTKDGGTLHNFAGQEFTKEIAENSNSGVKYLTMADQASGAVEYCYSRNKRNSDGTVDVKWYLPSADELEEFIVPAYSKFEEFQDNYYWTSQPAYIRNAFYYEYRTTRQNAWFPGDPEDTYAFRVYEDNPNCARATKVTYVNGSYDTVKSGLNETPATSHNLDSGCANEKVLGYFGKAYAWYRYSNATNPTEWTSDTHFNEFKDGKKTNDRYHLHLGHSVDEFFQKNNNDEHGYHERTKNNRVRCVRKMN